MLPGAVERSGLFIELPEPRAWPGGSWGGGVQKNHTAGAGPRREACVSQKKKKKKGGGWGVCWVGGRVLKKRSAAKVWVRSARGV